MVRVGINDPAKAWRRYVARTEPPEESTPSLRIGQGLHACLAGWPGPPIPALFRCSARSVLAREYDDAVTKFGRSSIVLLAPEYETVRQVFDAIIALETSAADKLRYLGAALFGATSDEIEAAVKEINCEKFLGGESELK
jgi:hypothetical protein